MAENHAFTRANTTGLCVNMVTVENWMFAHMLIIFPTAGSTDSSGIVAVLVQQYQTAKEEYAQQLAARDTSLADLYHSKRQLQKQVALLNQRVEG